MLRAIFVVVSTAIVSFVLLFSVTLVHKTLQDRHIEQVRR